MSHRSISSSPTEPELARLVPSLSSASATAFARLDDLNAAARMLGLSQSLRDSLNMVIAPYEDRADQVRAVIEDAGHDLTDPAIRDTWHREFNNGRTLNPHEGLDWAARFLEDAARKMS